MQPVSVKGDYLMKVYFIADLHFGHRKIIGFDNRPWDSLQSMEAEMIRRWNERVTDRDHVFIVGDFCAFSSMSHAAAILRRLKGHKHLIRGNHDLREPVFDSFFEDVSDYRQITVRAFGEKQNLVLCHYFRPFFRGARQGGIHFVRTYPQFTGRGDGGALSKIPGMGRHPVRSL